MNKEKYPFKTNNSHANFEFESHGPKGRIKKIIEYYEIGKMADETPILNLGFGDWDDALQTVGDLTISNNADRDKILATVASTVLDVTDHFGNVAIYAKGSTPARTRLYQMGINANIKEIETLFNILGLTSSGWENLQQGVNYTEFLVTRKKHKFE
ncbi:DUF6934 family protein [Chitinophaga tropicalis]|uniref:Uncharacterized protein n=1 Tax=Chitinophaga tropicalis TaxID=2683588 RepID=A0A7K1U3Z9_9BACT|nr:hypothetical protein [Chitinophaga tropicalis]MVT09060.1 hypothetical protein [Chitinophaga tropicalis]